MNRIPVSLILIALLTSAVHSSPQSNPDAIPFEFFASFKRIEKSNPVFAGELPEWAAAAHAIVVEQTVHYLWALREKKDRRWVMMHSYAPVSDPSAVKHDPRNPILSPSANGFDNNATEYPFPFWNPADNTYYAYYLGRRQADRPANQRRRFREMEAPALRTCDRRSGQIREERLLASLRCHRWQHHPHHLYRRVGPAPCHLSRHCTCLRPGKRH